MWVAALSCISTASQDNDTAPTVEYDDVEDSHGTIFRFDLRAIRYVKVWSSISSTSTSVHFSEIVSCHFATILYILLSGSGASMCHFAAHDSSHDFIKLHDNPALRLLRTVEGKRWVRMRKWI